MNEQDFYVELVRFVTKFLLDHMENQSEALKLITVGVNSALKAHQKNEKGFR